MGGNAFPHLNLTRIRREDIAPTVEFMCDKLSVDGLTFEYVMDNLMGSAGKQDDSGDLDVALNGRVAKFYGEPVLPVFNLHALNDRCREVLSNHQVNSKTLKGGQLQTAWPIAGDPNKGMVQVDFILGDTTWLKFAHSSPGLYLSPWKGVYTITVLATLAKFNFNYMLFDTDGQVKATVGWAMDLEKGLYRTWRRRKKHGTTLERVDPDAFETSVPSAPRFSRVGYIADPHAVLRVLFKRDVDPSEVNTLEKTLKLVKEVYKGREAELEERFVSALARSGLRKSFDEVGFRKLWRES